MRGNQLEVEDPTSRSNEPTTNTAAATTDGDNTDHPTEEYSIVAVVLVFLVPSLGGFLFGYDIAATSFVLKALTAGAATDDGMVNSTALAMIANEGWSSIVASSVVWQGVVVSLSSAGALISSMILFLRKDLIGRRTELQLGSLLYILGAVFEFVAGTPTLLESSHDKLLGLLLFMLGRLVYGLGIGVSMHAAPTYLGEMGPSSIRGVLVSLKEACIVLGIVMGYTLGYVYSEWRYTYASTMIPALVMLVLGTYAIPESCRWLLLQGPQYEMEALKALRFVFPQGQTASQQLQAIQAALEQEGLLVPTTPTTEEIEENTPLLASSETPSWKLLLEPKYRQPLTAGFGLIILQQVTGQPSVLSYATQIFAQAGVAGSAAIAVALFKLVATLTAAFTVELYGRVKLLLLGCSLMLAALLILTLSFGRVFELVWGAQESPKWLTLLAMFVYIGGYQVGFGPISWLMTSEIFPLAIRGQAVAVAVQLNFFLNAVVQFGVPVVQRWLGLTGTFAIFAMLDLLR